MPVNGPIANGMIQAAEDEIDSTLGMIYQLPLNLAMADPTVEKYLKRVAALIASGRLILSQATASEDDGVHSYGRYLLEEGKTLLAAIKCGDVDLLGVTRRPELIAGGTGPSVLQEDTYSLVDGFYAFAHRGVSGVARMGGGLE